MLGADSIEELEQFVRGELDLDGDSVPTGDAPRYRSMTNPSGSSLDAGGITHADSLTSSASQPSPSPLNPSRFNSRRLAIAAFVGLVLLGVVLLEVFSPSPGSWASDVRGWSQDGEYVEVTVWVRNTGSESDTASCNIDIFDPTGSVVGGDTFTGEDEIESGDTGSYTVTSQIDSGSVTSKVTVDC